MAHGWRAAPSHLVLPYRVHACQAADFLTLGCQKPPRPPGIGTSWSRWGGDGAASPSPPPSGEIFDARLSHDVSSSRGPFPVSVDSFLVPGVCCSLRTVIPAPSKSCQWRWWQVDSCATAERSRATLPSPHPQHGSGVRTRATVAQGLPAAWCRANPRVGCCVVRGQARRDVGIMSLLGHL